MNLVFLDFSERWNGSSRVFAMWAQELALRGHHCTRVVLSGSEMESIAVAARCSVHHSRFDTILARRVRSVLGGKSPELVFVHTDREHVVAAKVVGTSRARVIRRIPAGGSVLQSPAAQRASKRATTRYVLTSESPPSGSAMKSGMPAAVRIELGVAVPAAQESEGAQDGILCIASREAVPRAAVVLRALALLVQRRPTLGVRILGTAASDSDFRILASALGLASRIEWFAEPYLTPPAMPVPQVAIVVGDGDDAALGVLECMAQGVPVLSERTTVAARYVSHGIHGTLFAQLETATLAAELAVLLSDDKRRKALGHAGRSRVEREFALHEMIAGVERVQRDRATP